jgi:hypothetical protein
MAHVTSLETGRTTLRQTRSKLKRLANVDRGMAKGFRTQERLNISFSFVTSLHLSLTCAGKLGALLLQMMDDILSSWNKASPVLGTCFGITIFILGIGEWVGLILWRHFQH